MATAQPSISVDDFYYPLVTQQALHGSPAKNLLGIGGNGSGKSYFLLGESFHIMTKYPGAMCLLLRRDYPELEKGLIKDFKDTAPEGMYKYNDQKHIVTWPNGSTLYFGHLQNGSEKTLSQYLSSAFVWIGIDELGQFSYSAYSFLSSRNRLNVACQPSMYGDMPIPRMGGATNPLGPGYGWIKRMWIEKQPVSQMGELFKYQGKWYSRVTDQKLLENEEFRKKIVIIDGYSCLLAYDPDDYFHVHSTIVDNPFQMQKDPEYITKLAKLPPALRQKALYGDLNSIAGQYFSNFTYERHVLSLPRDSARIVWESWQPVWMGIDWGLAHSTAVYWFQRAKVQSQLTGEWHSRVVALREMVFSDTGLRKACRLIYESMPQDERCSKPTWDEADGKLLSAPVHVKDCLCECRKVRHIFLSPERFSRKDEGHTTAEEMGDILHALGLCRPAEANARRIDGALFMYNLLESGDLQILEEQCPLLIAALQTVVRDTEGISKGEDVLKCETVEDDCYDAARYGLLSMLDPRRKPEALVHQEKLASIKDHTARVFYAYEHLLKQQEKSPMVKPLIVPRWMKQ